MLIILYSATRFCATFPQTKHFYRDERPKVSHNSVSPINSHENGELVRAMALSVKMDSQWRPNFEAKF
jgi:hypothetical protein